MSDNIEMQINDSNEWINWIKEAISKKHMRYYEYKHFRNIEKIGNSNFGKVYRANWKNSDQYLVLKSFYNFNNITVKEIIHEFELQREVDFHDNVIRLYGIAEKESQNGQLKKYLLVMEYADGSSLRNYLKENFKNLTWDDKYKLAYQLACAVMCLHDEGIVHRNLHSGNILVSQNTVKLADFGLSKRIEEATKQRSNFCDVIPYVEPKKFDDSITYSLDKKSDVYSVGVLLWEISSGQLPFEDKSYDADLIMRILQGLREKIIPKTPEDYAKIYIECWNGEPDNRPTIEQIVSKLNEIIIKTKSNERFNSNNVNISSSCANNSLHEEKSQMIDIIYIQHSDKMNVKEVEFITTPIKQNIDDNLLFKKDLGIVIDELVNIILKEDNFGKQENAMKQHVLDCINNHKIISQEVYNWLLNNQNNSNFIYLLGYFNYYGIGTDVNKPKAFKIYQKAANLGNSYGIINLGCRYEKGIGTDVNKQRAFKLYQEAANLRNSYGIINLGRCYEKGIGTDVNKQKTFELYKNAADLGNSSGIFNLGCCYKNGIGVKINRKKAFKLYKKAADLGNSHGINNLGYCYEYGIGTGVNKQKAFKLYQKAADLGNSYGIFNLGHCYKNGIGTKINKQKTFELYQKATDLGNSSAINNLGCCYEKGIGTDVDKQVAFKLYQKATDLGNSHGINNLGNFYKKGIETEVNKQKAFELYKKAGYLENNMAQYNLAVMYRNGIGVEKDMDQAVYWFKKSAEKRDRYVQNELKMFSKKNILRKFKNIFSNQKSH